MRPPKGLVSAVADGLSAAIVPCMQILPHIHRARTTLGQACPAVRSEKKAIQAHKMQHRRQLRTRLHEALLGGGERQRRRRKQGEQRRGHRFFPSCILTDKKRRTPLRLHFLNESPLSRRMHVIIIVDTQWLIHTNAQAKAALKGRRRWTDTQDYHRAPHT